MASTSAPDSGLGSRDFFMRVFEELKSVIIDEFVPAYGLPKEAATWMAGMIDYNVPGGKLNRGLTVVHVLQAIKGPAFTEAEAHRAAVLGWCIEWLQAFFLVADDVMDASITRRGQPCWYKVPAVGMTAVNDGMLLQSHLLKLIKRYFGSEPTLYMRLLELFNEVTWQTELGQLLDLTSQPAPGTGEPIDLERFTLERYQAIVKYKTAYYSFFLPIACGFLLAGGAYAEEKTLVGAERISVLMGEYFQVQDDYLDAHASPEVLGKVGTDIQDNKCSWLVVQALLKADPSQRATLKEHYGVHKEESIACVKQLYKELQLEEAFLKYEQESYTALKAMIDESCTASGVPQDVFLALLGKIYKRVK